ARRVSVDPIFGLENSFKVFYGQVGALTDPSFFGKKVQEEQELRQRVAADPALAERIGDPWGEMDAVVATQRRLYLPYRQLEAAAGQRSQLYAYARSIVRASKERAKAAGERRAGYSDADIEALGRRLSTQVPVANDVERIALSFWLTKTRE
ncbi:S46 family peptidase, partial [Acinetobacter baumannii]|uniref:S46 family peptidase n=2 Tax=Pseudomonadota TaxID=1224 RepID=UPI00376FDD08